MPSQTSSFAESWESIPGRSTRAIVDLDVVAQNVRILRNALSPRTRLMAVVKANGYGHGAVMIARTVVNAGADALGVATVDEGLELRSNGIQEPILTLGPIDPSEIRPALASRLALSIGDENFARAVAKIAATADFGPASIHLKIDTGMRRFGVLPDQALNLAKAIAELPSFRLAGTFSHFASADEVGNPSCSEQFQRFSAVLSELREAGIDPGTTHISNSAAALRDRAFDLDMVRIGLALYGLAPSREVGLWPGMQQAMTIQSKVARVIRLNAGDRVSYGGTYRAERDETAALVPIGYADGYPRRLSNCAWMEVNGQRAPVRGRICMDQTVVGLPKGSSVKPGERVTIVGDGSDEAPTLCDLARMAGTINYEVATAFARRILRIYVRSGTVVATENLHGLRQF